MKLHRIDVSGSDSGSSRRIPDPPGYSSALVKEMKSGKSDAKKNSSTDNLIKRQEALFSLATSPFKQACMMAFMMYMAGTQLHLFSIMATMNGIYTPLNAIMKSGEMFKQDPEGKLNVTLPRLVYCLIHGIALSFAVYRIHLMGLLPTHLSDWIALISSPEVDGRAITHL